MQAEREGSVDVAGDEPSLVDVAGAARHLGTTDRHTRHLVAIRAIPHYRVGGKLRFRRAELDDYLESRRVAPSPNGAA